jgi:HlyD family secretion protein
LACGTGSDPAGQIGSSIRTRIVTVPLTALFRDGERWALFVASDGTAQLRYVELGQRNGVSAQVLAGLEAGEQIVLHPSDRVVDGVRIAPRG